MPDTAKPALQAQWQPLIDQAANRLRELALNEDAKARICSDPILRPFVQRVAQRYVAGQTTEAALQRVAQINARGHAASADYLGESYRDAARANEEAEVFLDLVSQIADRILPPPSKPPGPSLTLVSTE